MEFGAKEILIVLGLAVLIAIILELIKRIRASKYENIRMPKRKQPIFDDDDFDEYGSELPSGGARVVGYREVEGDLPASEKPPEEKQIDQPLPEQQEVAGSEVREPEATEPGAKALETRALETMEQVADEPARPSEPAQTSLDLSVTKERSADNSPVAVIHLMSPSGSQFDGLPLKNTFLSAGLRYGSMKIFHRHQSESGSGPVLFSVANSINPGTFELNDMDDFSSPGVTLFFSFAEVEKPLQVFDLMLKTAQQLNAELGGELKDETRSVLTRQTIEHYRQKVADFERTRLAGEN